MKILCPTDFSDHSRKALAYAIALSNDLQGELHILSAYDVPQKAASFISLDEVIHKNTMEDLNKLMSSVSATITSDVAPSVHAYRGNAVDVITKFAADREMDLILMGTQGNNSVRNILFGSVTRKVINNSKIPVLAIPVEAEYKMGQGDMIIALDSKSFDYPEIFDMPKKLAEGLGVKIDVLHVNTPNSKGLPLDPLIAEHLGAHKDETIILEEDDVVDAIRDYADKISPSVLVMIKHKKGFFKRLLTVGHTADEVAKTTVPLLILSDAHLESDASKKQKINYM